MTSYELELDVAGSPGPGTQWGDSAAEIRRLNYEFDGWLGDDLVTSTPVTIVTTRVRDAIAAAGPTGAEFADVLVTRSEQFEDDLNHCNVTQLTDVVDTQTGGIITDCPTNVPRNP